MTACDIFPSADSLDYDIAVGRIGQSHGLLPIDDWPPGSLFAR